MTSQREVRSYSLVQPHTLTAFAESLRHEKLEISNWAAHETSEDQDSDESEDESTEEESDD